MFQILSPLTGNKMSLSMRNFDIVVQCVDLQVNIFVNAIIKKLFFGFSIYSNKLFIKFFNPANPKVYILLRTLYSKIEVSQQESYSFID